MKRIALIHGNDGTDVRVGKFCRSLSRMGFDMHFIGWDRRPQLEKSVDLGSTEMHLMVRETPYGRPTAMGTVHFAAHIGRTLSKLRPETVCCVNEDNVLLALPYKKVFYKNLVCDVHDELPNRKSHKGRAFTATLTVASHIARACTDHLIAVDQTRYEGFGRYRPKTVIIENYPEDPGPDLAKTRLVGPIKVYVCGGLYMRCGIQQIVNVLDSSTNVQVVSAGWLYDEYANEVFAKHPKVSFRGIVTARESLALAAQCDAILAFYEPTSVNNLQASPNKVYDAMSVGRPVIINEEAKVSQWVVDNDIGMRCSYYDVESLANIIRGLEARRPRIMEYSESARKKFVASYTWQGLEYRLGQLFSAD